jgi:hypothetical protein
MLVILLLLISSAYIELTGYIEGTAQGDNLNFKIVIYYNNTRYLLANHIFFATNGTNSCYGYTDQYGSGKVTMGRPFFISVPSFVPTSYGKNDFASNSFYREVGRFFNVTGICPGSRNSLDPHVKLVRESDLQVLEEPWWVISTTPTFQYHLDRQVNSASADFLALTVAIVAFIVLAVIRDPSILGWLDFSKFIYNVPYNPPSTEMTVNKGNITETEKGYSIIQDESDKRLTDEHNKFAVIGNLSSSLAEFGNKVGPGLIYLAYLIEGSDKKTPEQKEKSDRQGERDLPVQESSTETAKEGDKTFPEQNEGIAPGLAGQDSTSVQSLDEVSDDGRVLGGQELTEYDPGFGPGQTGQDVPSQTFTGQDLTEQGPVDVQSLETEIGKELYREGERNLPVEESIEVAKELYRERDSFVQDDQTRQDVVPDLTAQNEDIVPGFAGQGPVDVQSLETEIGKELYREGERNLPVEESIEVAKELYREGERDSFVQDDQTRQDVVPDLTAQNEDIVPGFAGQGPVDVQSLETEIGKELYREGERNLPVEESIEVAKELYREGERDSFVQDDQTRQDVVPDLTAQNEDIVPGFAGQGPVDVQSLETEIGKELYREGERNLPVEESIEVAKELYREGERDSFVQDDQTRQDVVPDLTAQNEDIVPGFAGQGPVDVQSLETEIGKELYREGERNLPVEESIEVAKELYRERDSFVQDDQTRQDVVPDLTAQNEDIVPGFAGQGPVDVQSLETEIGKELYREGERNLPVEESIEVAKELYREGERDSFVQDDQTRQDVVPDLTAQNEDIVPGFAGQGPVDVQSLETEIGKELYREGERNLPVEESIEVAKELYRERDSFVQDDQTRQDVVPDLTAQNEDIVPGFAGQGPVDVQSLETEIGKELYREGERNLPVEESIEVAKELYRERETR